MLFQECTSMLHVRLFVAELMKDKIGCANYQSTFEDVVNTICRDIQLPLLPDKSNPFDSILANMIKQQLGDGAIPKPKQAEESQYAKDYATYKDYPITDKEGNKGRICGYSDEFKCLIAKHIDTQEKGDNLSEKDFVDGGIQNNKTYFYVSKNTLLNYYAKKK